MTFQPGQSGNPGGRKKEKPWADALRMVVNENDADGIKKLRKIAEACVREAMAGDMTAAREIGDRLDGRPAQALVGDNEADPINVLNKIERVIVDPENRDGEGVPPAA